MTADPSDVERQALALLERVLARPANARLRRRLLRGRNAAVVARLEQLERAAIGSETVLTTTLPPGEASGAVNPPSRIGAFRLESCIGSGGMGEVWRARRDDGLYEQTVAVKFLRRDLRHFAERAFVRERKLLAQLEHPNIARLIDGGVTDDGLPWLMTEFVDGRPLDEASSGRSDADVVNLLIKAAAALQFAHARLIVHGDIKPANVLVDAEQRVKLVDFGIGGSLLDGEDPGLSGAMTRAFASPERCAGGGPSIADDIHALGKTLECLLSADAHPDLRAIADRACAPRHSERYDSVALLLSDLERWRQRLPVSARASSWRYLTGRFVSRHRYGVVGAAAAIAGLIALATVSTWQWQRAERTRAEAEQRFGEVRSLAQYQLFELYDALREAPGTVAIRADLAARSAAYLDRLRLDRHADRELRLEVATGYRRLALVQGLSGMSSLGDPVAAERSLTQSEALLQALLTAEPDAADVQEELGWLYADRWTLQANTTESQRINFRARDYFLRALALHPQRFGAQLGYWVTQKNEAYDLVTVGNDPAAAQPILDATLRASAAASVAKDQQERLDKLRVRLLKQRGDVAYYLNDLSGALKYYAEGSELIDLWLTQRPAAPDWLNLQGDLAFDVSGTLTDMPDRGHDALAAVERGLDAVRRVLEYGPDANAQKKLVMLLGQQALVYAELGQLDAAVTASSQSLAIRRERLADARDDPARIRDIAIAAMSHAELLHAAALPDPACTAARESLQMWQLLQRRSQLGQRDATRNQPHAVQLTELYCP